MWELKQKLCFGFKILFFFEKKNSLFNATSRVTIFYIWKNKVIVIQVELDRLVLPK